MPFNEEMISLPETYPAQLERELRMKKMQVQFPVGKVRVAAIVILFFLESRHCPKCLPNEHIFRRHLQMPLTPVDTACLSLATSNCYLKGMLVKHFINLVYTNEFDYLM